MINQDFCLTTEAINLSGFVIATPCVAHDNGKDGKLHIWANVFVPPDDFDEAYLVSAGGDLQELFEITYKVGEGQLVWVSGHVNGEILGRNGSMVDVVEITSLSIKKSDGRGGYETEKSYDLRAAQQ